VILWTRDRVSWRSKTVASSRVFKPPFDKTWEIDTLNLLLIYF
jgi:hypothetical protein